MNPDPATLRRLVYPLLITVAVASVCGRILSANLVYEPYLSRSEDEPADGKRRLWPKKPPEPMPTYSSNDRSRWATVRALVDQGTYVIGHRDPAKASEQNKYGDSGIIFDSGWESIDKVLRPDTHDFYSSKPPLLTTLVAGEYWLLNRAFGLKIVDNRWLVIRTILITINAIPFLIYLVLLARLVENLGTTDWGRLFVFTAACFATFLTTFATTLNNHTVAACSALFALYPVLPLWNGRADAVSQRSWLTRFAIAGFFAAFTACVELPAASFAVFLFLLLLVRFPRQTLIAFVPAAIVPVAAFFVTNYLALDRLMPAYGEFGKGPWYEYEGSPWQVAPGEVKRGIDWAFQHESRADYVFHFLFGHHGVFSLSPIWLLAAAGMIWALLRLRRGPSAEAQGTTAVEWTPALKMLAGLSLAVSVVVIGFYLTMIPRWNYGGWTSGPRWLFWLTPLWLLSLLPVADWVGQRRWGRGAAYVVLAFSVLSVSFPAWNPWRHPWIYQYLDAGGSIPY
jgi:hypothetical protein